MVEKVLALTYPGGKREIQTIAATAGDVVTNLTPGAGKRWLILYGNITLVTDANAANRVINLKLTDGTNETFHIGYTDAIVASTTRVLGFGPVDLAGGQNIGVGGSATQKHMCMGPLLIEGADQFRINIGAGLAGDSYSGYVIVLEL